MFPELPDEVGSGLSSGVFLSCSADNTIRVWRMDEWTRSQNLLSIVSPDLKMHSGSRVFLERRFLYQLLPFRISRI